MDSREETRAAALDFLKAMAEEVKAQFGGSPPTRMQRSAWLVKTPSTSGSLKISEREVLDKQGIDTMCQKMLGEGLSEQQLLGEKLSKAGIPQDKQHLGCFLPLLKHWLELPDPFAFEDKGLSQLVEEFVAAVVDGEIAVRSRDAICTTVLGINGVVTDKMSLDESICIRPITTQELWQYGEHMGVPSIQPSHGVARNIAKIMLFVGTVPSEEWNILDIEIKRSPIDLKALQRVKVMRANLATRESVLVALRLLSSGYLRIVPLEREANYGFIEVLTGNSVVAELGREDESYILDEEGIQLLKNSWPKLRQIVESQDHYLRLPAMRLLDGGGRGREEDAIIDYAIGLEALLLAGIRDELRYRFALRGATILTWEGGDRKKHFEELQDFYDTRSEIVHGGHVDETRLSNICSLGEKALRDTWWWHFNNQFNKSDEAIKRIDARILISE